MALRELYFSETSYLAFLDRLTAFFDKVHSDPPKKDGHLGATNVPIIFMNVKSLQGLSNMLVQSMKSRLEKWTDQALLADTFVKLLPFFKEYKFYCNNCETALHTLDTLLAKKKEIQKYVAEYEKQFLEKGKTLREVLHVPSQRVSKYITLLEKVAARTSAEHPDLKDLRTAISQLSEFTHDLTEGIRRQEGIKRTKALAANKNFPPQMWQSILLDDRLLLHEDDGITARFLNNRPPATNLLLFDDVLVFAQPIEGKKNKREIHSVMVLEYVWLSEAKPIDRSVNLLTILDGTVTIDFKEAPDQVAFTKELSEALARHLKRKGIKTQSEVMVQRYLSLKPEEGVEMAGYFERAKLHGEASMKWKSGASYTGSWLEGKMQGHGRFSYRTGEVLEGVWKENAPNGRVKLTCTDGIYEGDWEAGIRVGKGELRWANGDVYTGSFLADIPQGPGVFTSAEGATKYEGEWKSFLRHGQGMLTCPRYTYSGEWADDKREGRGTIRYPNGDEYSGPWKDDRRHGSGGVFKTADGRVHYEGEWANDKRNGKGTLTIQGEFKYDGEWRDDMRHGKGLLVLQDGTTYDGNFKDDLFELQGKLTKPNGESYDGIWHNGMRQGKGVLLDTDGSRYEGDWYKDERHGKGTVTYKNGSAYSGEWAYNARHGTGTFSTKDETIKYVGSWERERRHGKGVQTDKLGKYEGLWKDDKWHGHGVYTHAKTGVAVDGVWDSGVRKGEHVTKYPGEGGASYQVSYRLGTALLPPSTSEAILDSLFISPPPPRTFFKS